MFALLPANSIGDRLLPWDQLMLKNRFVRLPSLLSNGFYRAMWRPCCEMMIDNLCVSMHITYVIYILYNIIYDIIRNHDDQQKKEVAIYVSFCSLTWRSSATGLLIRHRNPKRLKLFTPPKWHVYYYCTLLYSDHFFMIIFVGKNCYPTTSLFYVSFA